MEDGHTLFDYDVRPERHHPAPGPAESLVLPVPVPSSSGARRGTLSSRTQTPAAACPERVGQVSSNSGEAANEPEGKADEDGKDETSWASTR